ncbi:unnamed protein product [Prorocentrum cordatum]|uniref:Uncharacterized protein n=1 Tax=Prorocentrum cordatum TaxID=2364126 RepID=A0ABN9X2I3_9DINO|nr:unnamed protein product [Polarella glacialis]
MFVNPFAEIGVLGALLCTGAAFVALWLALRVLRVAIIEAIEVLDDLVLGVDVQLEDLQINLFSGRVQITQLVIDNPEGYSTEYLLDAHTIMIDVSMSAFLCTFGRHLVVEEIVLRDVDIIYDKGLFTSNVSDVLDHIKGNKKTTLAKQQSRSYCSFKCLGGRGREAEEEKLHQRLTRRTKKSTGRLGRHLRAKADTFRGCCDRRLPRCEPAEVTIKMVSMQNVGMKLAPHVLQGLGLRIQLADITIPDLSHELDGALSTVAFVPTVAAFLLTTLLKSAVATSFDIVAVSGDFLTHSVSDFIDVASKIGLTVHQSTTASTPHEPQVC